MNIRNIVATYKINKDDFIWFITSNKLQYSGYDSTFDIPDAYVAQYVELYQQAKANYEAKQREAKEQQELAKKEAELKKQEAEMEKRKAMSEMLITSGFSFDGYKITKYSGYISGDDAVSVDRGMAIFGSGVNVKDKLMDSLVVIRRNALIELKEAAYALGCNAVIGVDFDYLTLDPQTANFTGGTTYQPYIFGVTANGNAVIIEKIDE